MLRMRLWRRACVGQLSKARERCNDDVKLVIDFLSELAEHEYEKSSHGRSDHEA
jgi:hypothetical protein